VFLNRDHTEGLGLPTPSGFTSREQTIARYEQLLDRPRANFYFHEVFAAVRATTILMRVGTLLIDAGLLPPPTCQSTTPPASFSPNCSTSKSQPTSPRGLPGTANRVHRPQRPGTAGPS
jgi:hypothetical protein